ncbi:MAG: hypothetical protein QM723_16985 [Myxococcaceae bacterium]
MRAPVFASLLLLCCTTVEREGPRLSVEELSRECHDTLVKGTMERGSNKNLHLKLSAEASCKVAEASTVTTERYHQTYVLTFAIALVSAVAVAIPTAIGGGMLGTAVSDSKGAKATGATLGVLPGIAVGLAVAAGVPPLETRVEDGQPKQVEHEVVSENKRAPGGMLRVAGDTQHFWVLEDGKAAIPLADAVKVKLSKLTFDEVPVQLDAAGNTLDLSLDPCREALDGFKPTEAPVCPDAANKLAAAKQCNKNGWDLALPVEAKFGAVHCAPVVDGGTL